MPPRASTWGVPDWHFVKIATLCFMVFGATLVMIRERIRELAFLDLDPVLVYEPPRPVRWDEHTGWRHARTLHPIPGPALARIQSFPDKVRELKRRELLPPPPVAVLSILGRLESTPGAFATVEGGEIGGAVYGAGGIAMVTLGGTPRITHDDYDSHSLVTLESADVDVCLNGALSMTSRLTVGADGRVKRVLVMGVMTDRAHRCVIERLSHLRFSTADAARTITARWQAG
jgi:hypothetical protein